MDKRRKNSSESAMLNIPRGRPIPCSTFTVPWNSSIRVLKVESTFFETENKTIQDPWFIIITVL